MRGDVPAPITSFVGRGQELRALRRLLPSRRLITLVGPGGCGKTRLAAELLRRTASYEAIWVNLVSATRPEDARHEVARSVGSVSPSRLAETLARHANGKRALLVLDNCEHVLGPIAEIAADVLAYSDATQVLATSREPLDVEGELVWRVPSLSLPAEVDEADPQRSLRSDSVRLFVERARLAAPEFAFDRSTCRPVVAVCRAVDGIPLAIELAAARLRHVTVAELAGRLDDLLTLLVGSRRAGDRRHNALGAAIEWSHSLLTARQRKIFRRLSLFPGGFRMAAAEAVCRDVAPRDVLLEVASLVDKSLVLPPTVDGRYRMLEPIREYARDRLDGSGERASVSERCASYLVDLVMTELPDPMGMGRGPAVHRVAEEFVNLGAVLPWLIKARPGDAVRTLARFAQNHWGLSPTHGATVHAWLCDALAAYAARDATRAEGLLGRVQIMLQLDDVPDAARPLVDEAVAIADETGDDALRARTLSRSAFVAAWRDPVRALSEYDASIPILRGSHLGALALALAGRAVLRQKLGDARGADADIAESLDAWERHSGRSSVSRALTLTAASDVAFQRGDIERAVARARDAVLVERQAEEIAPAAVGFLVSPIEFLAHLAAVRDEPEVALRLAGFADRIHDEGGAWPRPWFALADRSWLSDLESRITARGRTLRAEGRRMSATDAVALALGQTPTSALSPREAAVCGLVAEGLTDKEIAARLAISERTAESHVQRIRDKLKLRSRTQVARWFAEHAPL